MNDYDGGCGHGRRDDDKRYNFGNHDDRRDDIVGKKNHRENRKRPVWDNLWQQRNH
jgi:hypothetical protein